MVSVIIPCHNEESSIGSVIKEIPAGVGEIIVVNNNSTDKTAEIARAAGAIVISEPKIGYGAAIKAGFQAAKGDIFAVLDGDGQHPAGKILEMVSYLEQNGLDFVSASRFPMGSGAPISLVKIAGNKLLVILANALFGLKITDLLSGMWAFKRSMLDSVNLESDGMALTAEIKLKVAKLPFIKFGEYRIQCRERAGKPKSRLWRDGFDYLMCLIKLRKSGLKSNSGK